MTFNVHNTQSYLSQQAQRYLTEKGCQISYSEWENLSEEEFCLAIQGHEAVIAGGERYTRRVLEAADKLKIIARVGAGTDRVDLAAATERGIWVTNTPGANGAAVADFTIGLILSLLRNIHNMAREMKEGKWQKYQGRELGGLTLGIVGTGAIGREVIKRARGFGTAVVAYDIGRDEGFAAQWQVAYVPLDELMARSDIVSLHTPLTTETTGLIDERRLGLMKRTAYLINTSRAPIVDRAALLKILQAKAIAGAGIDVHDPEPCAPDDPLVQLENVLATPWTAYNTTEARETMSMMAAQEVVAVLEGRMPHYPVNKVRSPTPT
jgi:D-3-phosphoglycerate dehydrogenase